MKRNKEKHREYMREWRKKNPDKMKKYNEKRDKEQKSIYWKKYYSKNKKKIIQRNKKYASQRIVYKRGWRLKKKEEKAGYKKPDNCEICNEEGKIVYDHHHETGKFRGWICGKCNVAIGMVDENINKLMKIIKYLESRNGK